MAGERGLPSSWKVRRLDEVSKIIDSLHKTPSYSKSGRRMVRVTDVKGGYLDLSNAFFVSQDVYEEFTKRHVPKRGDIVFSRVGTYGNASYVATDESFCLGQNTAIISPEIDPTFLHLCLESSAVRRQIEETVVGSTQKTISLRNISALSIPIPPKKELKAIAHILGTLDDKIELNRRMNETLEATARAIFKSWFVDFDPVRAKMDGQKPVGMDAETAGLFPDALQHTQEDALVPKGWRLSPLREIADLQSGGTPKKSNDAYWNGHIPWISPKAMTSVHVHDSDERVTDDAVGNGTRLVPKGSVLVMVRGMGLHQGVRISQAQCDVTFNQDVKALVPISVDACFLLFAMLEASPFLFSKVQASGHGTGVLPTDILQSLDFVIPPDHVLGRLARFLKDINQKFAANTRESGTLATLRDTLLPKLLSGELRIPDADKLVEAAL